MAGQNNSDEKLTKHNAVLLHVDHQEGLYTGVRDIATLELKHNVTGLTKAALVPESPIEVTTTTESMWGPMIPELASALTNHDVIEQTVNAWDEPRVVQADCATGRKHLFVTGISTDVCLAFPATAALRDGYTSYAVVDASGGFSQTQVNPGVTRMVQAGSSPLTVAVGLLGDNAAPEAQAVYAGVGIPFSNMVSGLKQYWQSATPIR